MSDFSDKNIEIALNQLLYGLDKLKKLEKELSDKYERITAEKIHKSYIETLNNSENNKSNSGAFIFS